MAWSSSLYSILDNGSRLVLDNVHIESTLLKEKMTKHVIVVFWF